MYCVTNKLNSMTVVKVGILCFLSDSTLHYESLFGFCREQCFFVLCRIWGHLKDTVDGKTTQSQYILHLIFPSNGPQHREEEEVCLEAEMLMKASSLPRPLHCSVNGSLCTGADRGAAIHSLYFPITYL